MPDLFASGCTCDRSLGCWKSKKSKGNVPGCHGKIDGCYSHHITIGKHQNVTEAGTCAGRTVLCCSCNSCSLTQVK